jgi:hypothetical protein
MVFAAFVFAGLYLRGVEIPGNIVEVTREAATATGDAGRFRVTYEYRTGNGTSTGLETFGAPRAAKLPFELKPGAQVAVRQCWLPWATSVLAVEQRSIWAFVFFLLFAGCVVAGLGFAQYALWYNVVVHWRLVKYGIAAKGQIADIQTYAMPGWPWQDITVAYPLGEATFSVTASWQDVHRQPQSCALFYVPRIFGGMPVAGVEVGDAVTVLYDRARPSRAIPYEFSYFRC